MEFKVQDMIRWQKYMGQKTTSQYIELFLSN